MLVVGSSDLGPVAQVFLGSRATKILRHAPVPSSWSPGAGPRSWHEITVEDVFDRDYQVIEGTNPIQYSVAFNEAADRLVRPILDRTKGTDNRIIGSAMGDMNGYLPTHLSERCHPQGPDPVWNDEHCRNKRIMIDDVTRNALASERPATLATYRMELGDKFIAVKNIFIPIWIKGRRWGNFELAYRDD